MKKSYEAIIIGAGPAGLTAGIYAARYKVDSLIIGKLHGGMAGEAYEIENFPTYEKITGMDFACRLINQVRKLGVEIKQDNVLEIKKKGKDFEVITDREKYGTKKIIITTGTERRKLNLAREKEFTGLGISYCATCDAPFYKDKIAGVVGGGNAALTAALLLSKYATKVYLIYRRDKFSKAEPAWVDEVNKNKKIEKIFNSEVTSLNGEEKLEEIEINSKRKIKIDGLFVEIGSEPNTEIAEKMKLEMEKNYVKVDKKQKTSIKGVFAAGDLTNNPLKQVITACAEGAIAAHSAYEELNSGMQ
jgi:thioredoxin reductase (NADPH)